MKEKIAIAPKIQGDKWLKEYIKILDISCSDFAQIKTAYDAAYLELEKDFKYIVQIMEYKNEMLISSLEFSFWQGMNDNIEHFRNPQAPTFLDLDYNASLKEEELRKKPDYAEVATRHRTVVNLLPKNAMKLYEEIIAYQVFLDTYIPKMAHYYGFVKGNTVFKKAINVYEPDYELTNKYREWLSVYLNLKLE